MQIGFFWNFLKNFLNIKPFALKKLEHNYYLVILDSSDTFYFKSSWQFSYFVDNKFYNKPNNNVQAVTSTLDNDLWQASPEGDISLMYLSMLWLLANSCFIFRYFKIFFQQRQLWTPEKWPSRECLCLTFGNRKKFLFQRCRYLHRYLISEKGLAKSFRENLRYMTFSNGMCFYFNLFPIASIQNVWNNILME